MFTTLAVIAAIAAYVVLIYNGLVKARQMAEEAWSGIDVQLKRRYDLIPNLVEAAKKYLLHERETLEAVIAARNQARSASDAARSRPTHAPEVLALGAAEQALSGSLGRPARCGSRQDCRPRRSLSGPEGQRELR